MDDDDFGTGWAFPPGVSSEGSVRMADGPTLIEQSMRLILATYPGERCMRPHFGSRLRDFVFAGTDPDTMDRISREVTTALNHWEPRAVLRDVRAVVHPTDPALVNIEISYVAKGTDVPRDLVLPFHTLGDTTQDTKTPGE